MADSPSIYRDRVFSYSVYSNGTKVGDEYRLTFVKVLAGLNRIGKATLKFNAGDMEAQSFDEVDADFFRPGTIIRLDAGSVEREEPIFEGLVVQLRIEVSEGERAQMVVECRDCAYPATMGRKNRIFEQKKDSDIITEVLREYGQVAVDVTGSQYPLLMQYYCTDWDFALSRAEANGLFVAVRGNRFEVTKPQLNAAPVLTVNYGSDLIDFDGGVTVADQFEAVEAVSWDPKEQKVVTKKARVPELNRQGEDKAERLEEAVMELWQTDVPMVAGALQNWVDGLALQNGLARYEGSFMFYGCAGVMPGCTVELKGMGKRFNGLVYVGQVEHVVDHNVWTTRVYMGVPALRITEEPDVVAPPASGWVPGVEGLHIGKVRKISDDPQKENRILVELPWLNGEKKEVWARLVVGYAGKETGFFFYPEPGDEVVVGFFNNDPSHPVVLGSMYSSGLMPAFCPEVENNRKGIVTRENMKLEFDEKKKVIVLSTPGGNRIEISDEGKSVILTDQQKNKIVLDGNGICLDSAQDIELTAQGKIVLNAKAKIDVQAGSDLELGGMNIKATAQTNFTAKGNAGAELSAAGKTTVKGTMVMIN